MRTALLFSLRIAAALLLSGAAMFSSARAQTDSQTLVAKGEYLARAGDCIACHTEPGGALFAGGRSMATPFGTIYSPNITPDAGRASADGARTTSTDPCTPAARPDGCLLYPAMPFASYTKVTREDSDAIFAYLRSVPPVKQPNRQNELRFPYNNRATAHRLAHVVLPGGRVPARPAQVGRMEPRRLPGGGARPLCDVPHADQRARRHARSRRHSRAG